MFIPGASSDASGSWCFSIEPKNPYRKHGLDSLEISLLGTFALPVLPLATHLPLLHAAVQCGVFKGLFLCNAVFKKGRFQAAIPTSWPWALNVYVNGYGSKPWQLMNPKIASKWMFIPLKLIIIGFGPIPCSKSMSKTAVHHKLCLHLFGSHCAQNIMVW